MPGNDDRYAVEVLFNIEKDSEGYPRSRDRESVPCRPLNPECSLCIVASVPFYVKSVACRDVIATRLDADGNLEFARVVERGGYSVYRVWLHDASLKAGLTDALLQMGAVVEHDDNLIALGVPPEADGNAILNYLVDGRHRDDWGLQDGYVSQNPNAA
jgi:hypothetical protein